LGAEHRRHLVYHLFGLRAVIFAFVGQLQCHQPSSTFSAVSSPQRPFTVKVDPLNLVDANLDVGKPLFFIS
jgi:hypothetical protein